MKIGGLQRFSTIDYPGKICCIVFCRGCPLRCGYCHNQNLQNFEGSCEITEEELYKFLEKRIKLLDAVVFSGGEPLSQKDLKEKLFHVKQFGFLAGVHTSGYFPEALENIANLVDWVGLDIKTIFHKYDQITQIKGSGEKTLESLKILQKRKIPFEVRTTYDHRYMSNDDLVEIANFLTQNNIDHWVIQQCVLRKEEGSKRVLPLPSMKLFPQTISVEIRK